MKQVLFSIVLMCTMFVSCVNAQTKGQETNGITVYYFHGAQRCITCRTIEALTTEVLNTSYAQDLKNGKITYQVVDLSTPEGEKIGDKYEVAWSSLLIDNKGQVTNLTDMAFSYAKSQPEVFKDKLVSEVNKALK